ncbi:DUF1572 family protein [Hymenobacter rigui]|uniref:DUF1572 domain-containing protein n=1 Tax=Hymenobacter rigui TaxID=334424 RepID=A0A428KQI9_9BACT|nr:DUF1572 family protein [Hymenobacter rigui]RSK48820.1 DUF1572 domain-containing protein [Hymenobacter rigui]
MTLPLPSNDPAAAALAAISHSFHSYKTLADRALAQLSPADWLAAPSAYGNSIAVIVQHMVGNLRSRFTDFLTTDGEKPTRNRDQEFEQPATAAELPAQWEAAWHILFELLDGLQPTDLLRTVYIRGEAHTVLGALQRQVAHYAYHVGQIVQLAREQRGAEWQTLSIARGQSENFNARMQAQANQ